MLCGRIVKVLDELYVSVDDMGASEIAPDAVLAVDDDEPAEVTADFLHVVMDKLDTSLTDEQKLSVLKIAGGIKSGAIHMLADHSSVDIEYSQLENEFGTEKFSDEQHDAILLAGTQVHKSECKIFDSGASQNVEQERSMFIVYFPLKIPIPMKQGEGVLYATGVGIVMYNFKRDDSSVYSEPGFALHTPAGNKGMSIISKSSFQDLGFGYLAPPFVGATDFWFPNSWAPNPVPMVLSDAPKNFRSIPMFSHPGSNLSLVPVHSEASVIANNLERWSFTTGQRYDERSAITGLLNKLVDGGRYAKYHPNMMLSMIHSMSDEHPPGTAPQAGVEESKFDDADEPSAQELLDYRLRFPNRQPFLADAAKINSPLHHALHDAALNEALDSSRIDSPLSLLDAERERTLIYCSQLAEAKDRSLRDR